MNIYEGLGNIQVGDLIALRGSDTGPIGVVLSQIEVYVFSTNGRKKKTVEYRCCMVGKNGKMITMTFSERDLVVLS
jgi:hypothetical protein